MGLQKSYDASPMPSSLSFDRRQISNEKNSRVLCGAGSKDIIKMIIDGDPLVRGTATYPPKMVYDGIEMAVEHLVGGKDFNKIEIIPSVMVTKENAQEYYYPDSIF